MLCIFRLKLFSFQRFFVLIRFVYLAISRGWLFQVFVQAPIDIMLILCTRPSGKLSHRSSTCHMENHPLKFILNMALMHAHDGYISCFWQRKWAVSHHITHNYTELYKILPKFLFWLRSSRLCSCCLCRNHFKKKKKKDQNRIIILDAPLWTFSNSNTPQRPFYKWRWDCFPSYASLYIYLHCISSIILLPSHSVFVILHSLPLSCKSE